ncbi:MAG TPA: M48 family metallopeptidase [Pirellulales bacterium]|jgi:Zn-dependent protease with chaperone function
MSNRTLLASILGLMLVIFTIVGSVWYLQKQSTEQARDATKDAIREGIHEGINEGINDVEHAPAKIATDVVHSASEAVGIPQSQSPAKTDGDPSSAPPASDSVKQPADADPVGALFRLGHAATKAVDNVGQDLLALSPEQCRQIGKKTHEKILQSEKEANRPSDLKRLQGLLKPTLIAYHLEPDDFQLTILESDELNAFSHVGGYIYFNTKLLDLMTSDNELQFVLGHELGHLQLNHCARRITYEARAESVVGDIGRLSQLAYNLVAVGYSKDDEFAADAWSFRNMRRQGLPDSASYDALQHVDDALKKESEDALKKESKPEQKDRSAEKKDDSHDDPANRKSTGLASRTAEEIANHFRTHPPLQQRIAKLKEIKQ